MKQFSISAIGNSHIDMAWLWPWTETVEVVRNTFGTALQLMREYPEFKFTAFDGAGVHLDRREISGDVPARSSSA